VRAKEQLMKKISLLLVVVILFTLTVFSLVGCSQNESNENAAIEASISGFFDALKDGNLEDAETYLSSKQMGEVEGVFSILTELGVSQEDINEVLKGIFAYSSYTIDEIDDTNPSQEAKVTLTVIGLESITQPYIDEYLDDLGVIEEAVTEKVLDNLLEEIFGELETNTDVAVELGLDMVKEDDQWVINGMEILEEEDTNDSES
jgi:hypothetical protein